MAPRMVVVQAVDPNIGTSKRSDFFIVATMGLDLSTMLLHLLHIFRGRVPADNQAGTVLQQYLIWRPRRVLVEAVFAQANLVKQCRKMKIPVTPIHRDKSKELRLSGLSERYKDSLIVHPEDKAGHRPPWLDAYEEELCSIGWVNGVEIHDHDDQADAVNDAANFLSFDIRMRESEPAYHGFTVDRRAEDKRQRFKEAMREARRQRQG